jgi:hypothetical protein
MIYNKLTYLLFLVIFISLFSCNTNSDWKEYSYPESFFHVSFPDSPEFKRQDLPFPGTNVIITQLTYSAHDKSGSVYSVVFNIYPKEIENIPIERRLKGSLDYILSIPGTSLLENNPSKIDTFTASDCTFINNSIPDKPFMIRIKTVSMSRYAFMLSVIDNKEDFSQAKANKFFLSFSLIL